MEKIRNYKKIITCAEEVSAEEQPLQGSCDWDAQTTTQDVLLAYRQGVLRLD